MHTLQAHTNGCQQERVAISDRGQDLLESQYKTRKTVQEGVEALKDIQMKDFVKNWVANRKVVIT